MKKLLIIMLSALSLTAFAEEVKLALLQPRVAEGSAACNPMEINMVRGELRKAFGWQANFQVLTRLDVDAMLKEQGFQRSGMVDDEQRKKVGVMTGAQYICISNITKYGTQLYIEAYLVDVETGQMTNPATQYANVKNEDYSKLPDACNALAKDMLGEMGVSKNNPSKLSNVPNRTENIVINKKLLQERGFRFPNRQQEAISKLRTSQGDYNIICTSHNASELDNARCYGTTYNAGCGLTGLALIKGNSEYIIGYIVCGELAYPYLTYKTFLMEEEYIFLVGIQELRYSYACACYPRWNQSDTRSICPCMQKIFGENITSINFIKEVISQQINLSELQKSFEDFLRKGGSIDCQWTDDARED